MKPTVFFLINSIDLQRGGLTKASLKQASFFAEMGYDTHMLTFNFNPDYPRIRRKLHKLRKVHSNVRIRNMYEELAGHKQPEYARSPAKKASLKQLTKGTAAVKRPGYNAYRLYANGLYTSYIALRKNQSLNFIDYFNANRYRTKRETFDSWGHLAKTAYMDYKHNEPRQTIYYDRKQRAYLTQWHKPADETTNRHVLFHKDGSVKKELTQKERVLELDWLHDVIDRLGGKQSIVISDTRSTDDLLVKLHHPRAAKIWRLHSSHLEKPYTTDASIVPKVQYGMEHLEAFDAIALLTEEQKQDISNRFGSHLNLTVVPHYHETNTSFRQSLRAAAQKTDPRRCVIVSRLSSLKRLSHAIRAFRKVVNEFPDVCLDIWGTGKQEPKLQTLIDELDLGQNVFLRGYTYNPDAIYQRGLFSVTNSKSEGFALSILESMYNKTPVISYNIKYGPEDMIVDGENGYLIKPSIEQLADRMIRLFREPKRAIDMGENARKSIDEHFNKAVYKQKWQETINTALANKRQS
ncbi:glycosyltransferase [Barrientosiimonas marina]|uniref:Glycosyltransferase n=1 Tax=Lentibacillus kimchii TaxID=1542911 RepID=A0ABW2UXD6_9BACI